MDHLASLRCFVAVAEAQGFAAAARRLGLSASAATRAIAALEQHLGVLLLQRSTRSVRLTDTGERFLHDCRRILADLDEAEGAATGVQRDVQGPLAVTAPQMFGRLHVAPIAMAFLRERPQVQLRTLFIDRVVHLVDEGMDVAVRIGHLPDSRLTAVQVGMLRRMVVASPAYLAQHGEPQTPAELGAHRAVGSAQDALVTRPWQFGNTPVAQPQVAWITNNSEVSVAAAVAGLGLTRCMAYQAAAELRAGRLRIVLAAYEPPPIPVHIVYPAGRRAPAKVRAFVDFARDSLLAEPVLHGAGLDPQAGAPVA